MSRREELIASLKQFAYGETAHAGTVSAAIEREALLIWDDGFRAGIDTAKRMAQAIHDHPDTGAAQKDAIGGLIDAVTETVDYFDTRTTEMDGRD